ncbi:MAG TPA: PaaI family thioesterase [Methanoregulaceae archaeon]|nr:PaaI family thioesterase [Methanoregulaceae archaeon]HPD75714.1 PaaI family thioesterase [Methanoregulaceae archaeon]HRY74722.1 PaaI family thioesterase [Methanoregulaceae archaeon]
MTAAPPMNSGDLVQSRAMLFSACEFARALGLSVVEARDGFARILMPAEGKRNPHGVIHGGAIFTLADQAFAVAANAGGCDRVAVSASIQYIAPASGDLEAVADFTGRQGNFWTYRITVSEGERLIAVFDGTAFQVSP